MSIEPYIFLGGVWLEADGYWQIIALSSDFINGPILVINSLLGSREDMGSGCRK